MAADNDQPDQLSPWWEDKTELTTFARALVEADYLGDGHRVVDFFAAPQRWTSAHRIWSELGRPDRYGQPRFHEMMTRFYAERNSVRARGA